LLNIEIKHAGIRIAGCRPLVAGVAGLVKKAHAEARVLISGFSPAVVWLWRRQCPDVPCGLLFERPKPFRRPWPLRTQWLSPLLRPAALHPAEDLCSSEAVALWRAKGYWVNVWTVDEAARIEALAAMGVDGIITNQPARALATLAASSGPRWP
jgi:glycerophosphoryl diester phosphodiesterase